MGTEKNKISAYLTDSEFQILRTLAAQYEISKSQVVIMAIKALAGQSAPIPSGVTAAPGVESLGKDEVNRAIAAALAPIVEDVESLKKRLETLTALPEPSEPVEMENLPLLEAMESPSPSESMETVETAIAPAPSEPKPDLSQGLTQSALAARLGRDTSNVGRRVKDGNLEKWSQSLDPDNLAWAKGENGLFFPV